MASALPSQKTELGVTHFAISRIKRIIKEDEDISACSNDVVFLISMATELFAEFFAAKACEYAKREKRKTLLYKDLARAVKEHDSLFFLSNVIKDMAAPNPLATAFSPTKRPADRVELTAEAGAVNKDKDAQREALEADQHDSDSVSNQNVL